MKHSKTKKLILQQKLKTLLLILKSNKKIVFTSNDLAARLDMTHIEFRNLVASDIAKDLIKVVSAFNSQLQISLAEQDKDCRLEKINGMNTVYKYSREMLINLDRCEHRKIITLNSK